MPDGGKGKKVRISSVGDRLRSFLERVERLEDEKRALSADVSDIKREVKDAGFDIKVFNALLKERRMERETRQEYQALLEIYRAAVGDLDGTPLGEAARIRLMRMDLPPPAPKDKPDAGGEEPAQGGEQPPGAIISDEEARGSEAPSGAPEPETPIDLEAVRAEGARAADAKVRVTDNPWPAGDPRRAAWDEGWCSHSGNDGMEIPAAWRRQKK